MFDFPFDGLELHIPTDEEIKERILSYYESNKNEFKYWFPVVAELNLNCRIPKTKYFEYDYNNLWAIGNERIGECDFSKEIEIISKFADEVGYPVFIKTGLFSGKHDWNNTCKIKCYDDIEQHIINLIYASLCVGCDDSLTIVVREMLPVDVKFTAFDGMPITEEWRFFADGGTVYGYQPYWQKSSIINPSADNWEELLLETKCMTADMFNHLSSDAEKIAAALGGGWSVDFLKDADGNFWLIDIADHDMSYKDPEEFVSVGGVYA